MSRRLGLLPVLLAVACGAPHAAPVLLPAPAVGEVEWTVLLVGDTGSPDPVDDPTFAALEAAAAEAPARTAIVFLGDNVYPAGLPPEGDPARADAERVLEIHLGAVRRSGARAFFVLGNHDWRTHEGESDGGIGSARRQAEWVEAHGEGRARVVPADECPGPEAVDVGDLRLVFLDTQWWVADRPPPAPGAACAGVDSAAVVRELGAAIAGANGRPVIVAGHHPIESGGRHGGHFGWRHHIFPLTDLADWAWLPLPIIGSLYPLVRGSGVSDQDVAGDRNVAMRGALEQVFAATPPAIYASGHEHILQVIRRARPPLLAVSGTGSTGHGNFFTWTASTAHASAASGWVRVDRLSGGRLRVAVIELDDAGEARETWSDFVR